MEYLKLDPDIDSDPAIMSAGWWGARFYELLLKVSAKKDLEGRITPEYQNLKWLARIWNLSDDDCAVRDPAGTMLIARDSAIAAGLIRIDGDDWVLRGWEKYYRPAKAPAQRTAEYEQRQREKGLTRKGGRWAPAEESSGPHDPHETHATPPTPPTHSTPPTSQKPPPPTPSADSSDADPPVAEPVVVAEEVSGFVRYWRELGGKATDVPANLATVLAQKRAQYGPDVDAVMMRTMEKFLPDTTMNSHRLSTFLKPSVLDERMEDAARELEAERPRRRL